VIRALRGDTTVLLAPRGFEPADSAPPAAIVTIAGLLARLTLIYLESERLRRRRAAQNPEAVDPTELVSGLVAASFCDPARTQGFVYRFQCLVPAASNS